MKHLSYSKKYDHEFCSRFFHLEKKITFEGLEMLKLPGVSLRQRVYFDKDKEIPN